ncbi:medium-chain acyl-CoA ligase ACSF2, mitochondrial-like [Amphiura filiformis]|uniref:medium-chain acyl-CoA ligase ACSF2, mitochondrial-like n=1 Tax=Amphiura filiformis TaxID=82378 RepID=UPI003B211CA7
MTQISPKLTSSYIHVPNEQPCLGKTAGQLFNERANNNPDKEMYVFYADKEWKTYKQMQDESHQFARGLLKLGLKKGDTLGIWGGNHYEWLLAYLASFQIGVITLGIKVIVLMRSPADLCDKACQVIPELAVNSAENLNCQGTPSLRYVINAGKKCSGAYSLVEFMELGKAVDESVFFKACELVDFDDPLAVFFTSGSTGFPKAVTHAHRLLNFFPDLYDLYSKPYSVDAEDNGIPWISRFALTTSFGGDGAFIPILYTATTIIPGPTFDAQILASAIQDEKVTSTSMLIHHLNDILSLPNFDEYDFASLQLCLTGGSIIPRSLRDRMTKIANHILLVYGGTEGFILHQTPKDPTELLQGAAYPPVAGQEMKVIGPDEQIVPINTSGEICFRGRSLFMYYWGEDATTKAVKKSTGWYHTGLHPSAKVTVDELKEFCRGKVSDFLIPKYILFMEAAFPTTETGKFSRNQIAAQAKSLLGL